MQINSFLRAENNLSPCREKVPYTEENYSLPKEICEKKGERQRIFPYPLWLIFRKKK